MGGRVEGVGEGTTWRGGRGVDGGVVVLRIGWWWWREEGGLSCVSAMRVRCVPRVCAALCCVLRCALRVCVCVCFYCFCVWV